MVTRRGFVEAAVMLSLARATEAAEAWWLGPMGMTGTASSCAEQAPGTASAVGTVDVRQFGARGDGVTDDTPAIMTALNALKSAGGGVLLFPSGTYLLGESRGHSAIFVENASNIYILGSGRATTTLRLKDAGNSHMIALRNAKDCTITHLTIDGNRTRQTLGVHGIQVHAGAARLTIRDVHIKDCYHYGIGLQSGTLIQSSCRTSSSKTRVGTELILRTRTTPTCGSSSRT